MTKRLITAFSALTAMTAAMLIGSAAYACTGVYVGKAVSEDGSVMIARTEDMESDESKRFIVHQAAEHKAGEYFTDANGLKLEYPSRTYRYTAVPGSASRGIGDEPFGEAGFNELGVAATSTITAYPNEKALAADPWVKDGLYELSVNDIILSRASSAKEGIKIIADIVDKYGSGEGSIIMTADSKEAWYMEIYTGHQYAAVKLPEDMAAVIPNTYMLGETDLSSEDVIASAGIKSLPTQKGFIKQNNGKINLRETYSEGEKDSNSVRIWGGRKLLHGSVGDDPYDVDYELLFKPTEKISLKEVMNVTRYRYEDTKYDANKAENKYIRTIGTARQEECHILQIRPNPTPTMSCIEWLCMGNSEFTAFVPFYAAAMTDTADMCKIDAADYDEYSWYWASRSLSVLSAQNRELYGNTVKEFFDTYENNLIKYVKTMDNAMGISQNRSATANEYGYKLTYDIFNKTHEISRELIKFMAGYEGKAESEETDFKFSPKLSAEVSLSNARVSILPTVVTIGE